MPKTRKGSDPCPVGTVVKADAADVTVLRAVNDAVVKMKAEAYDDLVSVLRMADARLRPLDEKYQQLGRKAAQKASLPMENGEEWVFTLEDGVFTRRK